MRFLALTSILLLLTLAVIPSFFVPVAIKHRCAPLTPPTVPGTLMQPSATYGTLFINEALLVPHSTWNCSEFGVFTNANDTWIEIYNAQNQPFDLYSVHTNIDSGPNTNPFYLPFGSSIAPYGFLVIFPRLDSNFSATETSTVRLLIGSTPIDKVSIPPTGEDQSYARIPNGGSTWVVTSVPTIDANNASSVIAPTPTRTKAEATATARTTSGNNKGSGSSSGSGGSAYGNGNSAGSGNAQQQVDGVQPTWNSLKYPDKITAPPSTSTQSNSVAIPQNNNGLDIPRKILLTLLVIAFSAALFWCWRLFRPS